MKIVTLSIIMLISLATIPANGQDVTIWFGNPDGSPLVYRINSDETVPVWIQTNPDVFIAAAHIPLSTLNRFITERLGGKLFEPFINDSPPEGYDKGWDVVHFMDPMEHENKDGFCSQGVLGFSNLMGGPNQPLHCEEKCKIIEFNLYTADDDSLRGNTYDVFIEGYDSRSRGISLSDTLGSRTFSFEAHFSQVHFLYPGDINADFQINNTDLHELKKCLNGEEAIPWPESRADCNDDGLINGEDVAFLDKYLEDLESKP